MGRSRDTTDVETQRDRAHSATVTLRYPFNALVSYHYYKKVDLSAFTRGGLRMIGDSGAFSARTLGVIISVDEFADWVQQWKAHLCWVASLDVIHEPEVTWTNYRRLRDKHGLDVIPTIHSGDDSHTWVQRYAEDGCDFMGIGGMVAQRARPYATLPWLVDLMRWSRDNYPQMRFHGWGVTNPVLMKALPYYSVDSSNIGGAYRYGRLVLFDPSSATRVNIVMDGHSAMKHAQLLRRVYGVQARDVMVSIPANRSLLVRLTGKSYQLTEDYLRARHGPVSAPLYGLHEPVPGPNVHAALDTKRPGMDVLEELGRPGPHVHSTSAYGSGGADDLAVCRSGPHMHGTDGAPTNLMALRKGGPQ